MASGDGAGADMNGHFLQRAVKTSRRAWHRVPVFPDTAFGARGADGRFWTVDTSFLMVEVQSFVDVEIL
jgi:hypothetical protein